MEAGAMGTKDSKTEEKYITIAEYAKVRKVSTTAVYKRLETSLKPWYRVVDGKKLLLSSVLYEEKKNDYTTVVNNRSNTSNPDMTTVITMMQDEITRLQAQVDAQRATIQEKDAKLIEFAEKFAELANQAQQLHAAEKVIEAKSTAGEEAAPEKKKHGKFYKFLFGETD
ncbi:MAG: hypothetical protein E7298_14160 [Lachnospiraceae bacterium]|nr:hypothetical protein [Lachnospiraceae bacterium]